MPATLETDRLFALFMEHLPGIAFLKDADGRYVFVNRGFEIEAGRPANLCLGKTDADLWSSEVAGRFRSNDEAVLSGRRSMTFVESLGHSQWLVSKFPVLDSSGTPVLLGGLGIEVTEQRRAEAALRGAQERLRRLFEQSLIGVAISAPDTSWIEFNDRICEILGYSRDELYRLPWPELTHPDDIEADQAQYDRLLKGEIDHYSMEKRFIRRDGTPVWTAISIHAVRRGDGSLEYEVGLMEDIDQRKAAEAELCHARDTLQSLVEASPVAIMGLDLQDRVLAWNPAAERLFGWSAADVVGQPIPIIPEGDREWLRDRHAAVARGEKPLPARVTHPRGDGVRVEVRLWNAPLYDRTGAIAGSVCLLLDETEQRALESRLRASEERLRQLSRGLLESQESERRRIARELHDQIGQSLTIVKVQLQALQKARGAEESALSLGTATEVVDRAIEQVRDLSFALRPPVLDDLGIAAALRSYADRQARAAGLAVQVSVSPPDMRLPKAVETACFRVAEEAIVNAVRHASARHLWVELARLGPEVELVIRDDGCGFDAPATLHGPLVARLGLEGMVERAASAGGTLEIRSTPGAGAEVCVRFPRVGEAGHADEESAT